MNITIRSIAGGYIVKDHIDGEMFKKTRQELADYINPPAAKPEIEATDFLREESAKAQSAYKCTAPPFPSNQASAMNINAANQYCGGVQYSMSNLAQQQGAGITSAEKWNLHIANMEAIKASDRAAMQNKQKQEDIPGITKATKELITLAVGAGYGGDLPRFMIDLRKVLDAANHLEKNQVSNLQDDGK